MGYAAGAARHPDRLALVDDDGGLTWGERSAVASADAR
jgi:hypothetical protein